MNSKFFHNSNTKALNISSHSGLVNSPFSPLWAAASPIGLRHFAFGISREEFLASINSRDKHTEPIFSPHPDPAFGQVMAYLNGQRQAFTIPIDDHGFTNFQKAVYQAVLEILYGHTQTYGDIARKLGRPHAARAVGAANGANPLPIIIPCHRLVGADGSLRGYGGKGGITTKQWLLDLEMGTAKKTS